MDVSPEAVADTVVRQLSRGDTDPAALLDRLRHSPRPYYAWALAWAQWNGVLERRPDHETARRAVATLVSLEPSVNRLDRAAAGLVANRHAQHN